jgi:hypothetical protein
LHARRGQRRDRYLANESNVRAVDRIAIGILGGIFRLGDAEIDLDLNVCRQGVACSVDVFALWLHVDAVITLRGRLAARNQNQRIVSRQESMYSFRDKMADILRSPVISSDLEANPLGER